MSNLKSEQIRVDYSVEIEKDQPLNSSEIKEKLNYILGKENCKIINVCNKNVFCYEHDNKKEILLLAAVTYLGGNGQHPIFKKRMQLKKWYKDIVNFYINKSEYNVRFIGVYHYEKNIIFVEFAKDTYMKKKMNSSAAHVYMNDFYQAMQKGVFKREDRNGNKITTIKYIKFKEYLNGQSYSENELFDIFEKFNTEFATNVWIEAKDAIPEMYEAGWNKWKETEWPGWYLEYKINAYINKYLLKKKIKYVGSSQKKKGQLDFDLWFNEEKFHGDLKASDINKNQAPGNDQLSTLECINKYGKLWYVIYEHDTIKDSDKGYEATKFRTNYIKDLDQWPKNKKFDELSYHSRMKHSVKFINMFILEINKINFREILTDFNQGKQPNGEARNPKFIIRKKDIDNFVVYHKKFNF